MRVVMVINRYYPYIGGNEIQCKLLSEELMSLGVRVSVITSWLRGTRLCEDMNGIRIYRILPHASSKIMLWPVGFLRNAILLAFMLVRGETYDVIHVHQAIGYALGAVIAAKLLHKKSLVKVSGGGSSGNMAFWQTRYMGFLAIRLLKKADVIVSVSDEITRELSSKGIKNNVITIYNGVRIREGKKFKKNFYDMNEVGVRHQNIATYVGRLSEEKGVDILLKAWQDVIKHVPQALLVIVGDGPQRIMLQQLADASGMMETVLFTGEQSDVAAYLQRSDIFVLPSRGEGMSNALLEAMSYGLPCIVSATGGNLKLIRHNETGMTFDSEDHQSLARCMIELFQKEDIAHSIGSRAEDLVKNEFSIGIIANQYLRLYRSLLKSRAIQIIL